MSSNDTTITQLFNQMVTHKPKLAAMLPDDEDEDDDFDIRKLAAEIISSFLWPIGVELRRLFSAGMEKPDRGRLDQLLKTIERIMQFTSFTMMSQLLEEYISTELALTNDFRNQFLSRFTTLSMGNFTWLIRSSGNILSQSGLEPFMPEMANILNKKFYSKLDFWAPERNDIGHYQINLTDEEIQIRCYEYQERLTEILSDLAFLIKYPLVTVTDIKVLKTKRRTAKFSHEMKILNSASSDFTGKEKDYDKFSDNHSVILLKTLKTAPDSYLNLSPLIIDTQTETLDSPEKIRSIKKDIFLYTKWQNGRLHYLGTEVTDKCDLRPLSRYEQLVEEFKEYLTTFAQEDKS